MGPIHKEGANDVEVFGGLLSADGVILPLKTLWDPSTTTVTGPAGGICKMAPIVAVEHVVNSVRYA